MTGEEKRRSDLWMRGRTDEKTVRESVAVLVRSQFVP